MINRYYQLAILVMLSLFILSPTQAGPLYNAAELGDLAEVKRLISKGDNVDVRNYKGWTPLIEASDRGYVDIVRVLLANGAIVYAKGDYGQTALMAASEGGHLNIVKILLAKGAKIDIKDTMNRTAFFNAAARGHSNIVKMLLSVGADVNVRNQYGETALAKAVKYGHRETVKILLAKGAYEEIIPLDTTYFKKEEIKKGCKKYQPDYNKYHTIVHLTSTKLVRKKNSAQTALYKAIVSGEDDKIKQKRRLGSNRSFTFVSDPIRNGPGTAENPAPMEQLPVYPWGDPGKPGTHITFKGTSKEPFSPIPDIKVWNGSIDIDPKCGLIINAEYPRK